MQCVTCTMYKGTMQILLNILHPGPKLLVISEALWKQSDSPSNKRGKRTLTQPSSRISNFVLDACALVAAQNCTEKGGVAKLVTWYIVC